MSLLGAAAVSKLCAFLISPETFICETMAAPEIDYTARVGRMIDRMSGAKQEPSKKDRPRVPVSPSRQNGNYSLCHSDSGISIVGKYEVPDAN